MKLWPSSNNAQKEAERQARKVAEQYNAKAEEIMRNTEIMAAKLLAGLERASHKSLSGLEEEFSRQPGHFSNYLKDQVDLMVQNLQKGIEGRLGEAVDSMAEKMASSAEKLSRDTIKNISEMEKDIISRMQAAYRKYQEDLEQKKEESIVNIQKDIEAKIERIITQPISRIITGDQHEQIVREVLNSIKTDNLWR